MSQEEPLRPEEQATEPTRTFVQRHPKFPTLMVALVAFLLLACMCLTVAAVIAVRFSGPQ